MPLPDTILQSRYRIVRQLGQGGMGTVYEAIDERLDTTVALKETHFTDEQLSKQFEREARLLARLHHAALPKVIDHFSENHGQFLVMGFIQGEDLWEMLHKQGAFPVEQILSWADQLLDALDYLHTQEPPIIHRDIKPQNLKLTARGQIILLDFGLAKGYAGQISRVTTSGSIFGYTPNYAPLEQIQGTGTDARSDLYALAATLYHLMTGVSPPDVITRVTATTDGQPDPLRPANQLRGFVPGPVAALIHRAMSVGRTQRFASAIEMRETLRRAIQSPREAGRDVAEVETLPPTLVDPSPAERPGGPEPKTAPLPAAERENDDADARVNEASRLREAEEAVRRAAQERQRQEEEERERREAEEVRRKAEVRRRRAEEERERHEADEVRREAEMRRRKEERREQPPPAEPATSDAPAAENKPPAELKRRWKVISIAIVMAATVFASANKNYQYDLLGGPGVYLIFPFANSLLLAIVFGLAWSRNAWIVGLIVGSSYTVFLIIIGNFFNPITSLAILVAAFAGAHLGAFIARRGAEKSRNPAFFITK